MRQAERTRGLPDERRQRVLHFGARTLDPGPVCFVASEFGAFALHVQLARQTRLETFVGDEESIFAELDGIVDDLNFRVERTQVIITDRNVGCDAQPHVLGIGLPAVGYPRARPRSFDGRDRRGPVPNSDPPGRERG